MTTPQPPEPQGKALSDQAEAILVLIGLSNRLWPHEPRTQAAVNAGIAALRELQQRRAARGEPQGWQPIESAPLEGGVLVCYAAQAGPRVAFGEYAGSARWRIDIGYVQPTHWMPLPAPPKVTP